MEAVDGTEYEGASGVRVVVGPKGPSAGEAAGETAGEAVGERCESSEAVEAVGGGTEGVTGKVVVEGSIAVVEGGEGPEEGIKSQLLVNCMTGMTTSKYDHMIFSRK